MTELGQVKCVAQQIASPCLKLIYVLYGVVLLYGDACTGDTLQQVRQGLLHDVMKQTPWRRHAPELGHVLHITVQHGPQPLTINTHYISSLSNKLTFACNCSAIVYA